MKKILLPLIPLAFALPGCFAAEPKIQSLSAPYPTIGSIERLDPALDALLAPDAVLEKLAEGFSWSEGPVWVPDKNALLFSDVPMNRVYQWKEGDGITVFLEPSGFTGATRANREEGSNGLTLDRQGRLTLCQHGDRRIARLNADGKSFTTVVDKWEGKRFNSPNDLCFDRAGNVFFTDPPYGLPKNATAEIPFHGVYRLGTDGKVTLISKELDRPNGIALSADGHTLYVANSHAPRPIIMAFALEADGTAGPGRVFFDSTALVQKTKRAGAFDGLRVDNHGNVWATGPGGVLVFGSDGKHLGTILTGDLTGNCTFGGTDGQTLYLTVNHRLARIKTKVTDGGR